MQVKLNFVEIKNAEGASPDAEITTLNSATLIPIGKSGIHIKKKNRGSFTEYCGGKVTDACIQKAKNSSSSAIRKKAVFAENARGWARKHQEGGVLDHTPGVNTENKDISKVFVSLDTDAPKFALNNPTLFSGVNTIGLNSDLPEDTEKETTEETTQNPTIPSWMTTPYAGARSYEPASKTSSSSPPIPETPASAPSVAAPEGLKASIQKFLGVPYEVRNCSQFVSAVLKDMGRKESGNSMALRAATQKINTQDLQPGDLVFLKGTLSDRGKNDASHVAIVTDTSKLDKGIIGVAHSSGHGKKSSYSTWNLNDNYFIKHYLGAGRLS